MRNTLRHAFEDRGYLTWTCPAPEIALSIFSAVHPNVVLLDIDFVGEKALDLLDIWRDEAPQTRVIVESAVADTTRMREAMDHGAAAYLVKPLSLAPLFDLLEQEVPPPPPTENPVNRLTA